MYIFLPEYLKSLDISIFFPWSHKVWNNKVWLLLWSTHNSMFCPFTLQAPRITLMWLKLSWISYHKWVIIALGIFTLRIKYQSIKKVRYVGSTGTCFSPNYNTVILVFPIEGSEEKQSHSDHRAVCSTDEKSLPLRYLI